MSFRKQVNQKIGRVWAKNNNKDLYTGSKKSNFEDEDTETHLQVDHIVEVQLGEYMWENSLDGRRTTRGRLKPVVKLWNDIDNLNVTFDWLNWKKGSAFKLWKDGRERYLRDALLRYDVGANHRANICVAFEEAAIWLEGGLDELAEDTCCDLYSNMSSELDNWSNKTG